MWQCCCHFINGAFNGSLKLIMTESQTGLKQSIGIVP